MDSKYFIWCYSLYLLIYLTSLCPKLSGKHVYRRPEDNYGNEEPRYVGQEAIKTLVVHELFERSIMDSESKEETTKKPLMARIGTFCETQECVEKMSEYEKFLKDHDYGVISGRLG
ncbi:hypothetical protein LOTGIDRAFT_164412 [Lottia gigantea]|uniref:Uncharacterized protein n=1 Tax=Lottia gigantea TaxID=225164 RepID=V4A0C0_LOTGI|nr:hypothetical protein LOTGIDRAFT_164412 [Lottia gigantea]ESO90107.1 hypothetical protein LOTGIDRAFT_164412 [Lottia gigantea]